MKKLLFAFCLLPVLALGQTTTKNYIKTLVYRTETDISDPTKAQANVTYYDGIGRPMQNVVGKATPESMDIVTAIEYDGFGRQGKGYLPYAAATSDLSFTDEAPAKTIAFYSALYPTTTNPYSETFYDQSPLNKILKQAAPGTEWSGHSGDDNDNTIKFVYTANKESDAIWELHATATWNTATKVFDILLQRTGSYAAGELYKTITQNENKSGSVYTGTDVSLKINTIEEYTNKEGQLVLKRTFDTTGIPLNTYYVYDQFGYLSYVLPPETGGAFVEDMCFQYKYDKRNRLVEKRVPGKNWEFIVYDAQDRPVATGPTLSPFGGTATGWIMTMYDAFGRVAYTGWYSGATVGTSADRNTMQNNLFPAVIARSSAPITIDNIQVKYTAVTGFSGMKLLTVSYYDNYSFPGAPTPPTSIENQSVLASVKGLTTARWTRVLTTPYETYGELSYTFYDLKGRAIRTVLNNHLGGYTISDTKLDFAGKSISNVTKHKRNSSALEIKINEGFSYSNQDRLLTVTHGINDTSIPQVLSSNLYNSMGQLVSKSVGSARQFTNLQQINYKYNIRGWLTDINNVDDLTEGPGGKNDFFALRLSYASIGNNVNGQVSPLYNGNISECQWISASDDILRKYSYKYDVLGRLNNAYYQKPGQAVIQNGSYNESASYDRNGNITSLTRTGGFDDPSTVINIDNLTYSYALGTNKLTKVVDSSDSPQGFKDINVADSDDYTYDLSGNLTTDRNKGIVKILYNHLGLPTAISFDNTETKKIKYVYNAAGTKVKKTIIDGATTVNIDYLSGFQYKDEVLQFFPTAEGYVEHTPSSTAGQPGSFNYVYQYKDHQGNVRMAFAYTSSGAGKIILKGQNNYYPFGLKHLNYNMEYLEFQEIEDEIVLYPPLSTSGKLKNRYNYNGKEFEDYLGLNVAEMDYRQYDPALGRFGVVDPLATATPDQSPYHFAFNNPVYFSDPTGLQGDGNIFRDLLDKSGDGATFWQNNNDGSFSSSNLLYDLASRSFYNTAESSETLPRLEVNYSRARWDNGGAGLLAQFEYHVYSHGSKYGYWREDESRRYWDDAQETLDYLGAVPVAGEPIDFVNAVISTARGNYGSAALSLAAVVPVAGWAATAVKIQKHHIIPKAVYRDAAKAIQNAIELNGGFNLKKIPFPFHGNHPQYNIFVTNQLNNLKDISPGSIQNLQKDLNSLINTAYDNYKATGGAENLNEFFRKLNP